VCYVSSKNFKIATPTNATRGMRMNTRLFKGYRVLGMADMCLALVLSASLLHASSVEAQPVDKICSDEIISSGTFANVIVMSGTSCTLTGTVVVLGTVTANDAVDIVIDGDSTTPIPIGENIEIRNSDGVILIDYVTVTGDVKVENNTSSGFGGLENEDSISIRDSVVYGSVKFRGNTAMDEDIGIVDTLIYENVKMQNNMSFGSDVEMEGNTVYGNASMTGNFADEDLEFDDSYVDGNVRVVDNTAERELVCGENDIGGDFKVMRNTSNSEDIIVGGDPDNDGGGNNVGGNVTVSNNMAMGAIKIEDNEIEGKLTCRRNSPDPDLIDNMVDGNTNCSD